MDFANYWFSDSGGGPAPHQITDSLRFRQSQHLSRTPAAAGDRTRWTWSGWFKRGLLGHFGGGGDYMPWSITAASSSGNYDVPIYTAYNSLNDQIFWYLGTNATYESKAAMKLRDTGGWYHGVAVLDTAAADPADRWITWINGVRVTAFDARSTPAQNYSGGLINSTNTHRLGWTGTNGQQFTDGYLAECHFVDGTALPPTSFGEFNGDGVWVPIEVNLTQAQYGQNGFFLDFSDPANIGADRSGNGNNFTATNFELTNADSRLYDAMLDSPTDNFSTLNPLKYNPFTLSNANLGYNSTSNGSVPGTLATDQDFYMECEYGDYANGFQLGLVNYDQWPGNYSHFDSQAAKPNWVGLIDAGSAVFHICPPNTSSSTDRGQPTTATPRTYMLAYDASTRGCYIGINGTWFWFTSSWQSSTTLAGASPMMTMPANWAGQKVTPLVGRVVGTVISPNFGQRPFEYTPPAGFEPLSTAGLSDVAITNPSEHFQTVLAPGDQILSPRSLITAQPAAATSFSLNSTNLAWSQDGDGSLMFANELICGNQQVLSNNRTVGGSNTPSYNGQDYIEFDPPLALSGDSHVRWGNSTAGNGSEMGPSCRITYGDGTVVTSPQLNKTIDRPNTFTTYGNYQISDRYCGQFALDTSKTLRRIEIPAGMSGRYASNLQMLVIDGDPVIANPLTVDVMDGSLFNNGDIAISTVDGKSGVVTGTTATSVTMNSLSDWNGTYTGGEGIYQHLCSVGGFGPFGSGLLWIKDRANTNQHQLLDSVRGGNQMIQTPGTGRGNYVAPAGNSVAWCWATPGNEVTNNDGSRPSQCDANVDAGFSVITYQGGTLGATYGHGLQGEPDFIMARRFDANAGWMCYHSSLGKDSWIDLGSNIQAQNANNVWGVNAPTDAVFGVSNTTANRNSEGSVVAYCWRSVPGYSAFASYVGNGNDDGPFIYTGFRPAFVMLKVTTGTNDWVIDDSARDTYNPVYKDLYANSTIQEYSGATRLMDFVSNGFKLRDGSVGRSNGVNQTYIYAAFAEHPFGGGNVSPSPAR